MFCHKLGFIALGANLTSDVGPPEATLKAAIVALAKDGVAIRSVSRFFETPCFPAGAGPDYVNAAVAVSTDLPCADVLAVLHRIEADFGRTRDTRWGQRTLDLDLLAYGDAVLPDAKTHQTWRDLDMDRQKISAPDQLILPHPRLQDRAFVLVPVMDIAPDWEHPILHKTIARMVADLPQSAIDEVNAL